MEKVYRIFLKLMIGTPFGYIHRLLNYGLIAGKDATTRSRIRWSADDKTLYFDGHQLLLTDFVSFVGKLLDKTEELMLTRLLFDSGKSLPGFNLNIVDDPSNHNAGHYFGLDEIHGSKKARQRMMDLLQCSDQWANMVEVTGDSLNFHKSAVDEYMKWDNMFRELIALLIMFTCGISGRGTEMTSLRFINTMDGDRMIYIENGQIMIITEYHKSMALMDDLKVCTQYIIEVTKGDSKVFISSIKSVAWNIFARYYAIQIHD
jgi:hypothetical protein